ncbi:hypothetical protein DMN77_05885 [Paenibacillus sp. 79R4]|nr:hypothetical protein [Paenibacillus sp. 79R4]
MLNRTQRNFRAQMMNIQREENKKKTMFYSYIEDKHITGYYGDATETEISQKPGIAFRVVRFFLFLVFLAEVLFTFLAIAVVEEIKLEIGFTCSTIILFTLFIFSLISPRLVFMNSRFVSSMLFGFLTLVFFVFTLLMAILYQP